VDLGLRGKVVLVTGSASGIGAEAAAQFASEGAKVVLADINADAAELMAQRLREAGASAIGAAADVTVAVSVAQLVEHVLKSFGRLDVVVNNAGFTRDMRIGRMPEEAWDAVVDVVLKGAFLVSKAAVLHLREGGAGRIINVSSRAHLGNPGQVNYSAAKAGLIGFTRALALEEGRHRTTVNAIAPGIVNTAAVTSLPHYETIRANAEKTTPIPRLGTPSDVASAILFLASAQASYITGEVLHVTGGRY
jgi:3-oxoacyl-[acyl-carrier protein] reductase